MLRKFKEKKRPVCWGLVGKQCPGWVGGVAGHIPQDFVNQDEEEYDLCPERQMKPFQGQARKGNEKVIVKKTPLAAGQRKSSGEEALLTGRLAGLHAQQWKCLKQQGWQLLSTPCGQKPNGPFLAEWWSYVCLLQTSFGFFPAYSIVFHFGRESQSPFPQDNSNYLVLEEDHL